MKVTRLGAPQPILNAGIGLNAGGRVPGGGNDLTVLTSDGSNGRYWGENVRRITSNGSNILQSPDVNFVSGSNITFAVASNTLTISGQAGGGAAISAGSNSTRVREVSTAGASSTLWSPFDHAHDGIGTITSSSSNTMQRGTWNIRPGAGIALTLTDTDGDGEFDTTTIVNTGQGGGSLAAHAASHENGGSDEINVTGLTGAGGSGGFPLDDITLHGTYGDHFDVPTLDAKWTRRVLPDPAEIIADSWLQMVPFEGSSAGYLQPWTPTTEAEFQMAYSAFLFHDDGFGFAILNSSGTGVWVGWRNTVLGIYTVTTYTINAAAAVSMTLGSTPTAQALMGNGRKTWLSIKKKSGLYTFRWSWDGATWGRPITWYSPSAFTPSQIGPMVGSQGTGQNQRMFAVDWVNVIDEMSIGNNLMITPTSGTVTPTVSGTAFTGTAADVIDGDKTSAEWIVQAGATPIWFNAAFSVAQDVNRLRFYGYDHDWGMGYVEFSSGTKIPFYANAGDMRDFFLDFPTETTTFIKVWCHQVGIGSFAGWREIEAYLAS